MKISVSIKIISKNSRKTQCLNLFAAIVLKCDLNFKFQSNMITSISISQLFLVLTDGAQISQFCSSLIKMDSFWFEKLISQLVCFSHFPVHMQSRFNLVLGKVFVKTISASSSSAERFRFFSFDYTDFGVSLKFLKN